MKLARGSSKLAASHLVKSDAMFQGIDFGVHQVYFCNRNTNCMNRPVGP
jgi:hypothetical protein